MFERSIQLSLVNFRGRTHSIDSRTHFRKFVVKTKSHKIIVVSSNGLNGCAYCTRLWKMWVNF